MDAPCQRCLRVVGADRLVGGGLGHILCTRRGAENIFGPYSPSDLAAVSVPGDRQRDLDARRDVTLPPAPRHRIALTLEETVAGVGRVATDIQVRDALASAVHDVIDERPVAATHVDGFED